MGDGADYRGASKKCKIARAEAGEGSLACSRLDVDRMTTLNVDQTRRGVTYLHRP